MYVPNVWPRALDKKSIDSNSVLYQCFRMCTIYMISKHMKISLKRKVYYFMVPSYLPHGSSILGYLLEYFYILTIVSRCIKRASIITNRAHCHIFHFTYFFYITMIRWFSEGRKTNYKTHHTDDGKYCKRGFNRSVYRPVSTIQCGRDAHFHGPFNLKPKPVYNVMKAK